MGIILASFLTAMAVCVHYSSGVSFDEAAARHYIYWEAQTSSIIRDPKAALQVEMGQFMDIVCPFRNFNNAFEPEVFNLYNVTEAGFKSCNPAGARVIFACNLPGQENKLTIKFQAISPSPFGFRFQECQEYYFLAAKPSLEKPGRDATKNLCKKETERLRIKVGCSHENKEKSESTTTTTVSTTTQRKSTTSFYDRVKYEATKNRESKPVVVPDIKPVADEPKKNSGKTAQQKDHGGNGASRTAHFNVFTALFCAVLSSVWYFIHSTSS